MIEHRHADQTRSHRRRWITAAAATALSVVTATAIATSVITTTVARMVVTPPKQRHRDVSVLAIGPTRRSLTLSITADTVLPGRYGLWTADGSYVRLGAILWKNRVSVTRELLGDPPDNLELGRGTFSGWFYDDPKALGIDFLTVEIDTPLGPAPAWKFPVHLSSANSTPWVIIVHGRGTTRHEGLRAVPVFVDAGFTTLVVSYRNDGEAPASIDGRYGLGDTEWVDVESAITFALHEGATSVILMGWSMGGAIVMQTALRSSNQSAIQAVILESPVLEWRRVLDFQGRAQRISSPIRRAALAALSNPWGRTFTGLVSPLNFAGLDMVARASELTVPILIVHSDDDGFVPSSASHELAAARPDLVTFTHFRVARHTKLWNYNEQLWASTITDWLRRLRT